MHDAFQTALLIIAPCASVSILSLMFTSEVDHLRKTSKPTKTQPPRWYEASPTVSLAIGVICGTSIAVFVSFVFAFYSRFSPEEFILLFFVPILYEVLSIILTAKYRNPAGESLSLKMVFLLLWIIIPLSGVMCIARRCL
jgi:hypothetical protein